MKDKMDKLDQRYAPLTELLFQKATKEKIPLNGTLELSPICNMNCKMCYIHKSVKEVKEHPRPMMRLNEWISLAEEMKRQGTLYLLLTGGEPLLWPDFWTLYEKLHQMGFLISINTNGSLIDDTVIQRLSKMPPNRVNITLYGASEETYYNLCGVHGVYEQVVNAILKLKKTGILVRINGSFTPDNAKDIDDIFDFAEKYEIEFRPTTYMFPPIRREIDRIGVNKRFTPEEAAYYQLKINRRCLKNEKIYHHLLEEILKGQTVPIGLQEECIDQADGKLRCRAGKAAFWVTWDAYISLCGMMAEYKVDYRKTSFSDAWKMINKMSEEITLSGICEKCDNIRLCHACAAMAIAETGDVMKVPQYLCEMVKAMKKIARDELKS